MKAGNIPETREEALFILRQVHFCMEDLSREQQQEIRVLYNLAPGNF